MIKSGDYLIQQELILNDTRDKIKYILKNINPEFNVAIVHPNNKWQHLNNNSSMSAIRRIIDANKYNLSHGTEMHYSNFSDIDERIRKDNSHVNSQYVDEGSSSMYKFKPVHVDVGDDNYYISNDYYFIINEENKYANKLIYSIQLPEGYNFDNYTLEIAEDNVTNTAFIIKSNFPFTFAYLIPRESYYYTNNNGVINDNHDEQIAMLVNGDCWTPTLYCEANVWNEIPINTGNVGLEVDNYGIGSLIIYDINENDYPFISVTSELEDIPCQVVISQYDENDKLCKSDIHECTINYLNEYEFDINILNETKYIKVLTLNTISNLIPLLNPVTLEI